MFHKNIKKQLNPPLESTIKQHYISEIPITRIPGKLLQKKGKTPTESRCIIIYGNKLQNKTKTKQTPPTTNKQTKKTTTKKKKKNKVKNNKNPFFFAFLIAKIMLQIKSKKASN